MNHVHGGIDIDKIEISLPIPPSINSAYANSKNGRHKTKKYLDWEKEAMLFVKDRYRIIGDSWMIVEYEYLMPIYNKNGKKKMIDVFNYEKCLSDFLSNIIEGFDDHMIKKGTVSKENSDERIVKIKIMEI